jgi:transposase
MYSAAAERAPQIVELPFWHAVALVNGNRIDEALPIFADVFRREPHWRDAIERLVRAGQLPQDRATVDRITAIS